MEFSGKAIEFLKETYVATPAEESDAKRVKASDIEDNLSRHFPGTLITPHTSSLLVQEAFRIPVGSIWEKTSKLS